MTRFRIGLLAIAALSVTSFEAASAADGLKLLIQTQQLKAQQMDEALTATPVKQTVKKIAPGKLPRGGIVKGDAVSELSAQDCKNVGGKVITVTDNRCGASGKYCRMPDTNAVCIDILN
jgi:putative hemolysin